MNVSGTMLPRLSGGYSYPHRESNFQIFSGALHHGIIIIMNICLYHGIIILISIQHIQCLQAECI